MSQTLRLPLVLAAGVALRVALYALPGMHDTLSVRPELVTAVSSFRRVKEGVFLFDHVGSPYAGDVFHQPPLVFALFYPLLRVAPLVLQFTAACALFIAVDVAIALGLARLCTRTLRTEEGRTAAHGGQEIWLHQIPVSPLFKPTNLPAMVALMYVSVAVRGSTLVLILFAIGQLPLQPVHAGSDRSDGDHVFHALGRPLQSRVRS